MQSARLNDLICDSILSQFSKQASNRNLGFATYYQGFDCV